MKRSFLYLLLFCVVNLGDMGQQANGGDAPILEVEMEVDFGQDVGQNLGSLFEVYDAEGNIVAGAGFVGAYNSYLRNDRERLHFFLKPKQVDLKSETLPRINDLTGAYLSDVGNKLYARSRNGDDTRFYELENKQWKVAEDVSSYDFQVAGKMVHVGSKEITYGGKSILDLSASNEHIGENYYAAGHFFLKMYGTPRTLESNRVVAIPWTAYQADQQIDLTQAKVFPLRSAKEFVYSFGQLNGKVLAATNTGGVYLFSNDKWTPLVEPDMKTSYQVYAMINYYDRLLLGHYPTGELYEFDGHNVKLLKDWPPVMPGVSGSAREAQSLAIYGGDLHVGVWPWAEVWRYDQNQQQWNFAKRMFDHPTLDDSIVHPYEKETKAVAKVYNLWGQRVTSLIAMADSLYVSTSSKTGFAHDLKFDFLSGEKLLDYGRIYRLFIPGQLSAATTWNDKPTQYVFQLFKDRMVVSKSGKVVAEQKVDTPNLLQAIPSKIVWGRGVYGSLSGKLLSKKSNLDVPTVGAYLNFFKLCDRKATQPEQKTAIDNALDRFKTSGFNTVYPYVTTTSGAAYFQSELFPQNLSPDWDIVSYLIEAAKQRDLKVFPVFCVMSCGHKHPKGILEKHPEWALRTPDGEPMGHFCATNAEARDWITQAIQEFVSRYNTDGIMLDYLRYYNRPTLLDEQSLKQFAEWKQHQPVADEKQLMQQFKEEGITKLAQQISESTRKGRPDLEISIYSWGPHVSQNHRVAQPWPVWSARGYIDMVNISGYCYPDNYQEKYLDVFKARIKKALELNKQHEGRADITFCLGVKTSHGKIAAASWVDDYLNIAGALGTKGTIFFTWHTLEPYLDQVDEREYIRQFVNSIQ